jgi:hypothetical protein
MSFDKINKILGGSGLEVNHTRGDGFCLIHAIIASVLAFRTHENRKLIKNVKKFIENVDYDGLIKYYIKMFRTSKNIQYSIEDCERIKNYGIDMKDGKFPITLPDESRDFIVNELNLSQHPSELPTDLSERIGKLLGIHIICINYCKEYPCLMKHILDDGDMTLSALRHLEGCDEISFQNIALTPDGKVKDARTVFIYHSPGHFSSVYKHRSSVQEHYEDITRHPDF